LSLSRPEDALDDRTLVPRAQAGDPAACRALFDRHANAVASLLRRTFGPDVDVEDGLQQTFLVAFEDLRQLRTPEAFHNWLLRVALRTCRRLWWKRTLRDWLVPSGAMDEALWTPEELRPDLSPDDRATFVLLGQRLRRLPLALRQVVVVRHAFGHTLEETADVCGCSTATVSRRLAEAEKRLRGESQ
jgi:RNA polymerase sigma-70 factor (ECF subfamily)